MTWKKDVAIFCMSVCLIIPLFGSPAIEANSPVPGTSAQKTSSKSQLKLEQPNAEQANQEILSNESVIQLLKVGLSEDLIISKVQKSKHNFDVTTKGLIALKQAGVSDRLLHFLMDPSKPPEPKTPPGMPATASNPTNAHPRETNNAGNSASPNSGGELAASGPPLPSEVGVYVKKDNQWVEIQPEVVNWKTGGVLKNIATAGIVKGDVNGRINSAHSRNAARTPLEFLIYTAEGIALTEYQLIKLREQKNSREFRTITGGVFHVSGGATRDLLQFEGNKIASRMYVVNLPTLGAGEYGFLPPGAVASSHSSATLGKMYTFRVGE